MDEITKPVPGRLVNGTSHKRRYASHDSRQQRAELALEGGGGGGVQLIDELDDSCVIRAYINQSVWYHPVGHIPHFGSYFFSFFFSFPFTPSSLSIIFVIFQYTPF